MRAGSLKERVTFERRTPSGGDPQWSEPHEWVADATVWANVTPDTGTEKAGSDGVRTINAYTVRTRYRDGITSEYRIKWRGRTLDILSVVDTDSRRRELVIEAKEHPSRG